MDKRALSKTSIQKYLKRLKLGYLGSCLDTVLNEAKSARLTPIETLAYALSMEVDSRENKRLALGMSLAHFPRVCTLENFDFNCQASIDPAQIRDLARLEWIGENKNLLFLGPPGVGKTHLAIALGRKAVEAGYSVTFITASSLLKQLKKASQAGRLDEKLLQYIKPRLLIVDEIGYLPLERETAYLFYELVSRRYERNSLILTSNRPVGEWGAVFGENIVTTAILDRLLHHSEVVTIRGDSYRLLEKRRQGLFKQDEKEKTELQV